MKKRKLTARILALGICASLILQTPVFAAEENTAASAISTNSIEGWPQAADISSSAAVVMETSTKTTLYAKNMDQAFYPSAAVKIMTCLLALENSELTEQVTMTETGISGISDGSVNIASQLGETFTMEQCLYAIMTASANDISLQVAEHVGGSVDEFVQKMNARAKKLGCTDTVFTNPTGLPDENQHTTARDMALIMRAAMKNDTFRTIIAAASYTIPATNVSGGERVLTNKFTMINSTSDAFYEGCLGGKEGYTQASGSTLVCAAEKNGMTLICVILNGASGQTDNDAIAALNYGFDNFSLLNLGDDDFSVISGGTVVVPNGTDAGSLTTKDTEKNDKTVRRYSFSGTSVGTAVVENVQEESNTAAIDSQKNIEAAKQYSDTRTEIPYYVIGGTGLILLLLFLYLMIRVIKS